MSDADRDRVNQCYREAKRLRRAAYSEWDGDNIGNVAAMLRDAHTFEAEIESIRVKIREEYALRANLSLD